MFLSIMTDTVLLIRLRVWYKAESYGKLSMLGICNVFCFMSSSSLDLYLSALDWCV